MGDREKLLLIEDDDAIREALRAQLLLNEKFTINEACSGVEGVREAKEGQYDLIILDAGMPDMDGREACRLMREAGLGAPIIMMIGADTEADAILSSSYPPNDYVTKPFKFSVLLARIIAQLHQRKHSEAEMLTVGPYSFRPDIKTITDTENRDRKIRLTEKEAAILEALARAEGRSIDRATLLNQVWGYGSGVTTHTLETHIYRLRQKIERDPSKAELLVTEPGGYRLVA